jgi:hypothetical protein
MTRLEVNENRSDDLAEMAQPIKHLDLIADKNGLD